MLNQKNKTNLYNPPEHVKKKMLMFFMRTSVPRTLEEIRQKEQVAENESDELI